MPTDLAAAEQRGIRMLHAILAVALMVFSVAAVLWVQFKGPLLAAGETRNLIAYIVTGIGLACVAVGIGIIRPKLPEPRRGSADYWTPKNRGRALLVWILCENGGTIAAVGFVLTAHLAALFAMVVAILMLVWQSPGRMAQE
jgi:hypothetical protein